MGCITYLQVFRLYQNRHIRSPGFIGITKLVRDNAGLADGLVVALVRVAIDPQIGLMLFDDVRHVQRVEGEHAGAFPVVTLLRWGRIGRMKVARLRSAR